MVIFPDEIEQRHEIAERYKRLLSSAIKKPSIQGHNTSIYAQYTIEVEDREALQAALQEKGIPTAVHYPSGVHEQPIFKTLYPDELRFPKTEHAARHVMSLPMHPYLTLSDQKIICEAVNAFVCEGVEVE